MNTSEILETTQEILQNPTEILNIEKSVKQVYTIFID